MNSPISPERKFLHDIATPLSTLKLLLTRVSGSLKGHPPTLTEDQQIEWLEKCILCVASLEELHAARRSELD